MIDQAAKKKILQANISNIVRKVKSGKPLAQKEIETIEKEADEAPNRGSTRHSFPILESLGATAARIGCPESLLKAAKRKGCKAFISGSRVDTGILIPFLFSMLAKGSELPDGFASWREVLESEKAKREAIKRQVDEKSVMPTADAERQAAEACAFLDSELQRGENELPPILAGLPAVECGKILHSFTEKVRSHAKRKFEDVGK